MAVATAPALRISPELALPAEAVTETLAILAKRGSGKTYTASVLVEEMLDARLQVVVLDPMGAWYGLRSSADGKGTGYPIAILGGDHADIPLEPTAGVVVADLLVDERLSAILDVSPWTKADRRRFVADLLERLYVRNREAMHLVLEEADLFAPEGQLRDPGDQRMLGAVYDIVRRGRGRGIGSTLITQRSASLSKEVLDQTEILVALRTTGPRDRKAIEGWINVHGVDEERTTVMSSLPSLPTGTAWVWWPVEGILRQVHIRERRTYDSSATPKPGERRAAPKTVADVDLSALQERMAATIERVKADDPKELRRRIRELDQQLATRPTETRVETVEKVVEVPVLTEDQLHKLEAAWVNLSGLSDEIGEAAETIAAAIRQTRDTPMKGRVAEAPRGVSGPARKSPEPRGQSAPVEPTATPPLVAARPVSDGEMRLGQAERTFLAALAQYPERGLSKKRLSLITGYSGKSGHFANVLGRLRGLELVERGDPIRITPAGVAAAGDYEPLPAPGEELVGYWMARLGKAESAFLAAFTDAYPASLTREELGESTGYSYASGHFANVLGRLRGLGLVDGWRASDELMGG
jgi:uncharacterized protein